MGKKAYLKATREKLGISYEVLAQILGMQKRTVQRMEVPHSQFDPFDDVIETLENLEDGFDERVLEEVEKITKTHTQDDLVQLTYWRNQKQLDEFGLTKADYLQVNAMNRAIEAILMYLGYRVEWSYPIDKDNIARDARLQHAKQAESRAKSGLGTNLV